MSTTTSKHDKHGDQTSRIVGGGGIFTVKMLTFSGKHAGNVMGGNELDCSAILLGQESSIFWMVVKDMLAH